jgi:hypothetical protein
MSLLHLAGRSQRHSRPARRFPGLLDALESRLLLSTTPLPLNPSLYSALAVEPVVSIVKVRNASEANPTATGTGRFAVLRSGGSDDQPLTVSYTLSGTADAADYSPMTGTVTIPAHAFFALIDVVPVIDTVNEPTKTVVATLAPDAGYSLVPSLVLRSATLTITQVHAVDFAAATGFTATGGLWNYDCSDGASATASAAPTTAGATSTRYTTTTTLANGSQTQGSFDWQSDGSSLQLLGATLWSGTLSFADLHVAPAILSGTFTDTSAVTWDLGGGSGDGAGTATVKTTLLGLETLTVPGGTYSAYKIDMKISLALRGNQIDAGDSHATTVTFVDDRLIYAVPGVGIVKMAETASSRTALQGRATDAGKAVRISVFRGNAPAASSSSTGTTNTTGGSTGYAGLGCMTLTTSNPPAGLAGVSGSLTVASSGSFILSGGAPSSGALTLNPPASLVTGSSSGLSSGLGAANSITLSDVGALNGLVLSGQSYSLAAVLLNSCNLASAGGSSVTISNNPGGAPTLALSNVAFNPAGRGTVGTLYIPADFLLNAQSTLEFDIKDASADQLKVTGILKIAPDPAAMPTIKLTPTGALAGTYTLATYAPSPAISAASFILPTAPAGYQWNINDTAIQLVPAA